MKSLKIGQRLTLSFAAILLLVFLGSLVGLSQINAMRQEAERVQQAGVQTEVLKRVYSQMLGMVMGDSLSQASKQIIRGEEEQARREQALALEEIARSQRRAVRSVIIAGLLTLLCAWGLGYLVTRGITRSLGRLGQGAQALARGDFSQRISEPGQDELAQLGRVFDSAAAQLQGLYQELQSREARFRALIENASEVVMVLGTQGEISYVSPSLEGVLGLAPEAWLGGDFLALVHTDDQPLARESWQRLTRASGLDSSLELRLPHADGSWLTMEALANNLADNPAVGGVVVNLRDISQRKRAEEALRESERKYRLLADNVTDVIWVLDLGSMSFTYVSPSVRRQRGYTPEEAMALSLAETLAPASLEAAANAIAEELERELAGGADPARTRTLELETLCKDGSTLWTEVTSSFVRGPDGQPSAIIGVSRDISERRQAQEQIRQSEEKYRLILEASPDPVVLYNIEGKVLYLNPAFTRVFGWTLPELLGKSIDYVPDEEWPRTREMLEVMKQGRTLYGFETRRYDKQGNLLDIALSWSVWLDRQGNPAGSVIILRNVTEQKKLEAQLEQARKMEAIGVLAGGIAHDFNNVLQAVSGNVQLLLLRSDLEGFCWDSLNGIDMLTQRAAEMIKQLLTLSRKEISQLEPVLLNREVAQTCRLLERILPKMIQLELKLAQDLRLISGDPAQLEQIVFNLAANASDAMSAGGQLIFETQNLDLDEMFCRSHPELEPGPHVLLKVSDTGVGMDRQTLGHIFEPFFTTKQSGRGTGLGLSTVYGIITRHKGLITCYSAPGQGTVFNIYLPAMAPGGDQELAQARKIEDSLRGGQETILLVDDEENILSVGQEILGMYGYQVLTAHSGEEALAQYQQAAGKVDLVVLDLGMPGMGGQRCLERLLQLNPAAKVIISSGYTTDRLARELEAAGARGFIGKPYRLKDMVKKVREALDR